MPMQANPNRTQAACAKVQILTQRGPWLGAGEDVQYNFDDLPHGIRDHGILVLSLLALLVQKSTNTDTPPASGLLPANREVSA